MRTVETIASGAIVWDSLVRGFGLRCQRTRKVSHSQGEHRRPAALVLNWRARRALDARHRARRGADPLGQDPGRRRPRRHPRGVAAARNCQ